MSRNGRCGCQIAGLFLDRPLTPGRAGVRCALALAVGVLVLNLVSITITPRSGGSFALYQAASTVLQAVLYGLIGLCIGSLLRVRRIGPFVVAWILGSIVSQGVRLAASLIIGDALPVVTATGQFIRSATGYAILGIFVGLGFRQVRIGGVKPRPPVLRSVLALVAASPLRRLAAALTYERYVRMGAPLYNACLLAGGLLGVLLVVGRPDLAREGVAQ